ncbi:hypothetical protein GY45DRAFT_1035548 [Cubamyces sp. BRFM 1775]|nr:hypothetical protein GY45DRAFT_1035548 [Cubamyces sp. BRFM 1775]
MCHASPPTHLAQSLKPFGVHNHTLTVRPPHSQRPARTPHGRSTRARRSAHRWTARGEERESLERGPGRPGTCASQAPREVERRESPVGARAIPAARYRRLGICTQWCTSYQKQ